MAKRTPPVEVAGFRTARHWVYDTYNDTAGFRWYSFANDDHPDADFIFDEDENPTEGEIG